MSKKMKLYELRYQEPHIINEEKDSAYWKVEYRQKVETFPEKGAEAARKHTKKFLETRIVTLPSEKKFFCTNSILFRLEEVRLSIPRLRSSF